MKKTAEICDACGQLSFDIQPHHRDRDHYNDEPGNVMFLCRYCHGKEHGFEGAEASDKHYDLVDEISKRKTGQRLLDAYWGNVKD